METFPSLHQYSAQAALAAALRTCETLRALFAGIVAGERTKAPLRDFNDLLAKTMDRLELAEGAQQVGGGRRSEVQPQLFPQCGEPWVGPDRSAKGLDSSMEAEERQQAGTLLYGAVE